MSERVADIKTRTQAIKCLTSFCEAVDPGLIFDRVRVFVLKIFSVQALGNWHGF